MKPSIPSEAEVESSEVMEERKSDGELSHLEESSREVVVGRDLAKESPHENEEKSPEQQETERMEALTRNLMNWLFLMKGQILALLVFFAMGRAENSE